MTSKPLAVVTGGAGFIGSHMVDLLLESGFKVHVIDNMSAGRESNLAHHQPNLDLVVERSDVRSILPAHTVFTDAKFIFHFAGIGDIVPSLERPADYLDTNIMGTVRVLEAARTANARKFVYAASSSCYGLAATPTNEDHPISPQYPYALSKYLGEQAAFHWHQVYGLPVNSIRIFNAYGTRSRTSGAYGAVFGVFLRQKLAGKPFTVVGDGSQTRDFVYVTDVARAFLDAARSDLSGKAWNVGAGRPQPVRRIVELLGGGEILSIPRREGEPDVTWADISRIRRELGWKPRVSFEEGVGRILEQIDYWKDAPLWDSQSIMKATETWFKFMGQRQSPTS